MPEYPISPADNSAALGNVMTGMEDLQTIPVSQEPLDLAPYPEYHPPVMRGGAQYDPTVVPEGETMDQMWARIAKASNPGGPSKTGFNIYPASDVTSARYPVMLPGSDNEDAFGQAQSWYSKAFHGVTKGVVSVGTTFVNSTVGLVDGAIEFAQTGKFSSMYNNNTTQLMDAATNSLEDALPNYYSAAETNAAWYSPTNLISANMLWDKFVKTLGFVVGAGVSGGVFSKALRAIGLGSEIAASGQLAKAVQAAEDAALSGEGIGGTVTRLAAISGKSATAGKYLDEGNKILTSGLSITGEAEMEALGASNDYRRNAIQKYRDEHGGEMPVGEDIRQINRNADAVGSTAMALNMALLTSTQYVQLPKILGSAWPAARSVENNMFKYLERDAAGKYAVAAQKKGVLPWMARNADALFSYSEAFEEVSQYAIEKGSQNYWNKHDRGTEGSFIGDLLSNYKDVGKDLITKGYIEALTSKEGMESLLLGGVVGGLSQRVMGGNEKKQQRDQALAFAAASNAELSVPQLTSLDAIIDKGRAQDRAVGIDASLKANVEAGNEKGARDDIYDNVHNTLAVRVKYGAYDELVRELKAYQQMAATEEGFNQLQKQGKANATDTPESFRERTDYLLSEAKSIYDLQRGLLLKYGGVRGEDGKPLYTPSVIEKMVYSASKMKNIDERSAAISSELASMGLDPSLAIKEAFKTGKESIIPEYLEKNNSALTPEQKDEAEHMTRDLAALFVDRKLMEEDYKRLMKRPKLAQEEMTPEKMMEILKGAIAKAEGAEGEEVETEEFDTPQEGNVKGRLGKMKVGQSYYLTNVVHSKKDNTVGRILPPFKVLKKNGNGTVTVQNMVTNETLDIGEGDVAPYTMHSVNAARKTKTGAWFLEHIMDTYEMKVGKGLTVAGRLSYRPQDNTLYFSYSKGNKIEHRQITNYDLVPQKGFREARITRTGTIQPKTVEQLAQEAASTAAMAAEQDAFAANKVEQRRAIMGQLISDTVDSITKVEEEIVDVKKRLDEVNEQLKDEAAIIDPFKLGSLVKHKEFLGEMIPVLEEQQAELEYELEYFKDVVDYMDELPTDTREFSRRLRDQVQLLQAASDKLSPSIEKVKGLIVDVDKAIANAAAIMRGAFNRFLARNPNTFTLEDTELGYVLTANPDVLTDPDAIKADLELLQEVLDDVNTTRLLPSRKKKQGLSRELERMSKEIEPIQKELGAAKSIYDKFSEVYKDYQAKEAEAAALKANAELQATIALHQGKAAVTAGTAILEPEEAEKAEKTYDSAAEKAAAREADKKPANILPGATTAPTTKGNSKEEELTRAFQKEHDEFTSIVDLIPVARRNEMYRLFVSSRNQEAAGLPGLIPEEHPYSAASVAKDPAKKGQELIYAVYVESYKGQLYYLNAKGERIEDPVKNINDVVRGIMPTSSLTWTNEHGEQTRYSRATAEEAAKYAAVHEQERNEVLNSEEVQAPHEFMVSRGIVVKDTSGKKHHIVGSLVKEGDMNKTVLQVVTDKEFRPNNIEVNVRPGSVMVVNGATVEYANNRRFTDREKALLKKVFAHFAKLSNVGIMQSNGKIARGLHPTIKDFLQGVLYFQHPVSVKEGEEVVQQVLSKSQFYIENGEIFFGRSEGNTAVPAGSVNFHGPSITDPTMNQAMVQFLSQAYHNVNNTFLKNPKQFNEIVDINEDSTFVLRTWPTYQHYLISPTYPDGSPRDIDDTPLSTRVIPEKNDGGTSNIRSRYTYNLTFGQPQDKEPIPSRPSRTKPIQPTPGAPVPEVQTMMSGSTPIKYTVSGGEVTIVSTPEEIAPVIDKVREKVEATVLANYNTAREADGLPVRATFAELDDDGVAEAFITVAYNTIADIMKGRLPAPAAPIPGQKTATIGGVEVKYTGEGDSIVIQSSPAEMAVLFNHPKVADRVKALGVAAYNLLVDDHNATTDDEVEHAKTYEEVPPENQFTQEEFNAEALEIIMPSIKNSDAQHYPAPTAPTVTTTEETSTVEATRTQALEDAEIIDSMTAQDGTQKESLAALINSGEITFTEDDGTPC